MASQAQIDSARRNGALSRGPKTPEGRRRSSMNALRHGFTASRNLVLADEDAAGYARIVAGYLLEFQPCTAAQQQLVEELASCQWRMRRAVAIDTAAHNLELDRQAAEFGEGYQEIDPAVRLYSAARPLLAEMEKVHRYEHAFSNRYLRIYRQLLTLRRGNALAALTAPVYTHADPGPEGGEK
jgi:hypothetical protein